MTSTSATGSTSTTSRSTNVNHDDGNEAAAAADPWLEAEPSTSSSVIAHIGYHREYLNRLWDQGMTNTKTAEAKRLMKMAVAKTQMHPTKIKNFIHNRRKKDMKSIERRMKTKSGGKRLYDIFMSNELNKLHDHDLTKKEKMKKAHGAWEEKKNDEQVRMELQRQLEKLKKKESVSGNTDFARKSVIRKQAKEIEKKCNMLNKFGYECLFLAAHKSAEDYVVTGTEEGQRISEDKNLLFIFSSNVVPEGPTSLDSLSDEALRNRVQNYFNEKYMTSLGKRRTEYHLIRSGQILVTGMPSDIPFRNPASYGRATKLRILKESGDLKFEDIRLKDVEELSVQNVEPEPTLPDVSSVVVNAEELGAAVETADAGEEVMSSEGKSLPSPTSSDFDSSGVVIHHEEGPPESAEDPPESAEDILGRLAQGGGAIEQEKTHKKPVKQSGKRQKKWPKKKKKTSAESEYFVEQILEAKRSGGKLLFLIKWEGYSMEDTTWEPMENLPTNIIDEFLSSK